MIKHLPGQRFDFQEHPENQWVDADDYAALAAVTRAIIAGIDRKPCTCGDRTTMGWFDPDCIRCKLDISSDDLDLARELSREDG